MACQSDGIGRHDGLKNRCSKGHVGSTPSSGTNFSTSKFMMRWTPNLAYAIGLIATDGNLSKDKRHISLTSTDKQLLRTFKSCLRLKNRICLNPSGGEARKQCYKVTFGDVKFYNQLLKIGLMPNKTFNLSYLKIPKKYFADFLRGCASI